MEEKMIEEKDASRIFQLLRANAIRSHQTMTVAFLTVNDVSEVPQLFLKAAEKDITDFIMKMIRQSDFLFKVGDEFKWAIVLAHSGREEAAAFINRLYEHAQDKEIPILRQYEITFAVSLAEVRNIEFEFSSILEAGERGMKRALEEGPWSIDYINEFSRKSIEMVKISIIEKNDIFRNALKVSLENLFSGKGEVEIRTFGDGLDFLESKWYFSSHKHLIIMEDILPRKNGMEVLNQIRSMPNNGKFIVFMMTKRNAEEDMMQAYEKGVDEYLIKPFNLRLFEARVRRVFSRIWI